MNLLTMINEANSEELNKIVSERLDILNNQANNIPKLGFEGFKIICPYYKGFIPFTTKDYFYEFAKLLNERKNIKKPYNLLLFIEFFINQYFGFSDGRDLRDNIFYDIPWQNSNTDEDFFKLLENNEIGNLKGENLAMCTERAAMAQNLLSFFGFESYYCYGCINNDDIEESHCFNIVKLNNNKYMLLDYSLPISVLKENKFIGYYPLQYTINENIDKILNGELPISVPLYQIEISNNYKNLISIDKNRDYLIGKLTFNKEKSNVL